MKHLIVTGYGKYLGLRDGLCEVRHADDVCEEIPLNRLRSITVTKGSSVSTDLLLACGARGIKFHVLGWNGRSAVAVDGLHSHAVVQLRKAQLAAVENPRASSALAAATIAGKIANQMRLLQYHAKYRRDRPEIPRVLELLQNARDRLARTPWGEHPRWREKIMGIEGRASTVYWQVLRRLGLLTAGFQVRDGRGSPEIGNQALNYGYAILMSRVWQCVGNAGLEPFAGFLHTDRPGKPSLVLDLMEIYRPWVVDRCVIALRARLDAASVLSPDLKKEIAANVCAELAKNHLWRGKRLKLENIIQRQVYAVCGTFVNGKVFRPFHFKW